MTWVREAKITVRDPYAGSLVRGLDRLLSVLINGGGNTTKKIGVTNVLP